MVEIMLEGYNAEFVGMLPPNEVDGLGLWVMKDVGMSVVTLVGDLTFKPFATLMRGEYGSSILEPDHLVVNPKPQTQYTLHFSYPYPFPPLCSYLLCLARRVTLSTTTVVGHWLFSNPVCTV